MASTVNFCPLSEDIKWTVHIQKNITSAENHSLTICMPAMPLAFFSPESQQGLRFSALCTSPSVKWRDNSGKLHAYQSTIRSAVSHPTQLLWFNTKYDGRSWCLLESAAELLVAASCLWLAVAIAGTCRVPAWYTQKRAAVQAALHQGLRGLACEL